MLRYPCPAKFPIVTEIQVQHREIELKLSAQISIAENRLIPKKKPITIENVLSKDQK